MDYTLNPTHKMSTQQQVQQQLDGLFTTPPQQQPTFLGSKKRVTWVTDGGVWTRIVTTVEMTNDVKDLHGFKWVTGWGIPEDTKINVDYQASEGLISHVYAEHTREGVSLEEAVVDRYFPPEDDTMQGGDQHAESESEPEEVRPVEPRQTGGETTEKVTPTNEKGDDDVIEHPPPGFLFPVTPNRKTRGSKRPAEGEPERAEPKTSKVEGAFGAIRYRTFRKPETSSEEPGRRGIPLPPGTVVEESEQQKADRLAKEAEEAKKKAEAEEAARLEEAAMNAMVLETSGAYREELGGAIRKIKLAELKRADRFMPAPALMTDLYKFANNKKLFFEWKTSGKPWLFMVALNHYQPTGAVASVLNDALTLLASTLR